MLVLLLALALTASPEPAASPGAQASSAVRATPAMISPDALFSRRALRRAKLLIQMRVMEFREEQLECIRRALRGRLPEALWPQLPSAAIEECAKR